MTAARDVLKDDGKILRLHFVALRMTVERYNVRIPVKQEPKHSALLPQVRGRDF